MNDLIAFLRVRLDEAEEAARKADKEPRKRGGLPRATHVAYSLEAGGFGLDWQGFTLVWDPARVLADVAAKRRIVGRCEAILADGDGPAQGLASLVLLELAAEHDDHEDYREGWRL